MNDRRRITGVVTSNKMKKTVVVEIGRTFRHPLYRKVVHLSKRVMAHDEMGCQIGDHVQIVESRPLSRESAGWLNRSSSMKPARLISVVEVAAEPESQLRKLAKSLEAQP